ncbi:hypothetical protein [Lacimicrobium sp. SS2-24]|uniref:hypothetical protein n=1 Tax=Lacimicrobium sp. SS2-24 TaxID=2005569 RepID=UPI0011311CDB|nr:hypothetical protein [Lacimicrobium sp. SS2-24]
MKYIIFWTLLGAMWWSVQMAHASQQQPGMVLFNHESRLFASYFAGYDSPHNVQVLYHLETTDLALISLVRDAELVTIKFATDFDPQPLVDGDRFKVNADIYLGNYKKGGDRFFEQMQLTFNEQLYLRHIESDSAAVTRQVYDEIDLGRDARILIHQVQGTPSYEQVVMLFQNIGCIKEFDTPAAVPAESYLLMRLSPCGAMKAIYYDKVGSP